MMSPWVFAAHAAPPQRATWAGEQRPVESRVRLAVAPLSIHPFQLESLPAIRRVAGASCVHSRLHAVSVQLLAPGPAPPSAPPTHCARSIASRAAARLKRAPTQLPLTAGHSLLVTEACRSSCSCCCWQPPPFRWRRRPGERGAGAGCRGLAAAAAASCGSRALVGVEQPLQLHAGMAALGCHRAPQGTARTGTGRRCRRPANVGRGGQPNTRRSRPHLSPPTTAGRAVRRTQGARPAGPPAPLQGGVADDVRRPLPLDLYRPQARAHHGGRPARLACKLASWGAGVHRACSLGSFAGGVPREGCACLGCWARGSCPARLRSRPPSLPHPTRPPPGPLHPPPAPAHPLQCGKCWHKCGHGFECRQVSDGLGQPTTRAWERMRVAVPPAAAR